MFFVMQVVFYHAPKDLQWFVGGFYLVEISNLGMNLQVFSIHHQWRRGYWIGGITKFTIFPASRLLYIPLLAVLHFRRQVLDQILSECFYLYIGGTAFTAAFGWAYSVYLQVLFCSNFKKHTVLKVDAHPIGVEPPLEDTPKPETENKIARAALPPLVTREYGENGVNVTITDF